MSKRLKSIGFGKVNQSFGGAINNAINSAVSNLNDKILDNIELKLQAEIENANRHFDAEFDKRKQQIDDNIEKAKADAEVYADTIRQNISQEFDTFEQEYQANKTAQEQQISDIRAQATDAKTIAQQIGNQAKADATNALSKALQAKADAIAEATRLTTDAKQALENQLSQSRQTLNDISGQLSRTKQTLTTQEQQLLAQAQAQAELTKRTEAVEKTTNGTKTTLTELSKTVNNQTEQIDSVSKRTKTVEDGLIGLTTRYENLQSGFNNLILKSDDLENPHKQNGAKTTVTSEKDYFVITSTGYTDNAWGGMSWNMSLDEVKAGDTFSLLMPVYIDSSVSLDGGFVFTIKNHTINQTAYAYGIPSGIKNQWFDVSLTFSVDKDLMLGNYPFYVYLVKNGKVRIKPPTLVKGSIKPLSHLASTEDIRKEVAEYHQSATENYSNLSKNLQTADGKINDANTLIRQTAEAIKSYAKKSEVDTLSGRMTNAETLITQTGNRITTEIAETKGLIPSNSAGNMLVNSGAGWRNLHEKSFELAHDIKKDSIYTISARWWRNDSSNLNIGLRKDNNDSWQWINLNYDWNLNCWTATFKSDKDIPAGQIVTFYTIEPNGIGNADWATLVAGAVAMTSWQPSLKEISTDITSAKTLIEQTAEGQRQLTTKVTKAEGKMTIAETKINQLVNDVSSKVSLTDYNDLKDTVDSQSTLIAQNADQISLRAEKTYVKTVETLADSAKQSAQDALDKAKSNADLITETKAALELTDEAIKALVTKNDFNNATGRLSTLESSVEQHADLIKQRLTAEELDQKIAEKGLVNTEGLTGTLQDYVPSTTYDNYVEETAKKFERTITETKALIPSEYSGNILVNSGSEMLWYREHRKDFTLATHIYAGVTYTVTARWWSQNGSNLNLGIRANDSAPWQWVNLKYKKDIDAWTATFVLRDRLNQGQTISFFNIEPNGTGSADWATLSRGPMPMTAWQPSIGDLITETKFHNVKETVDRYERIIGNGDSISKAIQSASKFERSIVAGGDVYQAIETAKGLVQEVTGADGLKSQISQLKDSWAVKTLTDAGAIASQINASANNILIEAEKIRLKGKSLVDTIEGFSAKFDKIVSGEGNIVKLNSEIIDTKAIEGKHIKFDESFFKFFTAEDAMMKTLFAQRAFAAELGAVKFTATQISGGVLKALNDAMQINLNQANITFNKNATLDFRTNNNAIRRIIDNKPSQFIKFLESGFISELGPLENSTLTIIGSDAERKESSETKGFGGIKIWNGRDNSGRHTHFTEVVGNRVAIYGNVKRSPWLFDSSTTDNVTYLIPQNENGISHYIGRADRKISQIHAGDVFVQGERIAKMLKDLALKIGYKGNDGWADRIG